MGYFHHGDLGDARTDCATIFPRDDQNLEDLPRLTRGDPLLVIDPYDQARIRVLTRLGPVWIWQSGFKRAL